MSEEFAFRTAAFGGFNRKDVLEYITAAARKYRREIGHLQEENVELRESLDRVNAENADLRAEMSRIREESETALAELRRQLSETEEMVTTQSDIQALKAACEAKLEENRAEYQAALEEKSAAFAAELAAYQKDAEAYRIMRDRVGQIEMNAQVHAISVEKEADEKAAQTVSAAQAKSDAIIGSIRHEAEALRDQINALLNNVCDNFNSVHSDVADSIAKAMGEVDHVHDLLLDLNACMEENAGAINSMDVPDLPEDMLMEIESHE